MMIVGEAWGEQEELYEAPLVGPSGHLLRTALSKAGVDMDDCYLTNTFNFRPQSIEALCGPKEEGIPDCGPYSRGKWVKAEYACEIDRLWQEIEEQKPNVILALGATALWALCNVIGIAKHRGFITETHKHGYKVIPTWHPAAVLRNYKLFPVLIMDAAKAASHDTTLKSLHNGVSYACRRQ